MEGGWGAGEDHVLTPFSSEEIVNEKAQGILQVSLNNFIVRIFFK